MEDSPTCIYTADRAAEFSASSEGVGSSWAAFKEYLQVFNVEV